MFTFLDQLADRDTSGKGCARKVQKRLNGLAYLLVLLGCTGRNSRDGFTVAGHDYGLTMFDRIKNCREMIFKVSRADFSHCWAKMML